MSTFQSAKSFLLGLIPISKDSFHIYIGFSMFLLALFLWRRTPRSMWTLVPGFLVALTLEAFDLSDDVHNLGYARWSASFHDVVNTNAIPLVLHLMIRRGWLFLRRCTDTR